jgi:hypothetical protein
LVTFCCSYAIVLFVETPKRKRPKMALTENTMERLLAIEVTQDGGVTEEIELICTMTGFRRRFLFHYIDEGFFRSVELF